MLEGEAPWGNIKNLRVDQREERSEHVNKRYPGTTTLNPVTSEAGSAGQTLAWQRCHGNIAKTTRSGVCAHDLCATAPLVSRPVGAGNGDIYYSHCLAC